MSEKYCAGVKTTGYWKGYGCGARGLYAFGGKLYCGSHYAAISKDPTVFERTKTVRRAAVKPDHKPADKKGEE